MYIFKIPVVTINTQCFLKESCRSYERGLDYLLVSGVHGFTFLSLY